MAAKLLELAERFGETTGGASGGGGAGIDLVLPMTQGELATWVASSRESVNKVLGVFRDQRLIRLDGQHIAILDQRGLRRWLASARV